MVVRLLHPGVSPHIFRGAHEVWFEGERYDVLNAQGASLLAGDAPQPGPVPPALSGGSMTMVDGRLLLAWPVVTAGRPAPDLELVSLTQDGANARDQLDGNVIEAPSLGAYIAVFVATGFGTPATVTASLRVEAVALTVTPVPSLPEDAPIGTTVATISTAAEALALGGADADLLAIEGGQVVTAAALTDRDMLSFTVTGGRDGFANAIADVSVEIAAVSLPSMHAMISPDPLEANRVGTIVFNVAPDSVTGSVALTGSGTTRQFMTPASGSVVISAEKEDHHDFAAVYPIDTAIIQAAVSPAEAATHEGQTPAAIPGIATALDRSNYSRLDGQSTRRSCASTEHPRS